MNSKSGPSKSFVAFDSFYLSLKSVVNNLKLGAVVVAQLAEWSLLTPEIRGSNPVFGIFLKNNY